jgi:hypothetical protein
MKMKGTQAGTARELAKIRLLGVMSIQKTDDVCYSFVIVHVTVCRRRASQPTRFLRRF